VNSTQKPRRQRSDGARSRQAILEASARLATIEGLRGLSIGGLAEHIGMSKSGLYAHFGSKEQLQLATIDTAAEIFNADVVEPAVTAADPLAQLTAMLERFLVHISSGRFPGGCFFVSAAADVNTQPGQVRERIAGFQAAWLAGLADLIAKAQSAGDLDPGEDPEQLAFELNAMLGHANTVYLLYGERAAFMLARHAIRELLKRARITA